MATKNTKQQPLRAWLAENNLIIVTTGTFYSTSPEGTGDWHSRVGALPHGYDIAMVRRDDNYGFWHPANGIGHTAVAALQDLIRLLRAAREHRWPMKVGAVERRLALSNVSLTNRDLADLYNQIHPLTPKGA